MLGCRSLRKIDSSLNNSSNPPFSKSNDANVSFNATQVPFVAPLRISDVFGDNDADEYAGETSLSTARSCSSYMQRCVSQHCTVK